MAGEATERFLAARLDGGMLVSGRHQGTRKSTGAATRGASSEGRRDESRDDGRDVTARVIAAVREGRGGALFPPVGGQGLGGLLQIERWLSGAADARALEQALARPRFRPLRAALAELQRDCQAWRRQVEGRVADELFDVTRPALFGGVVSECYAVCALAPGRQAVEVVGVLRRGYSLAMQCFLDRLLRDLRAGVLTPGRRRGEARRGATAAAAARAGARVIELVAHRAETHNGRQFAIEVELAGGARWVYKPRPGDAERALLGDDDDDEDDDEVTTPAAKATATPAAKRRPAPGSLFALINELPAVAGEPRLPTLRVRPGSGEDGRWYSWHEWVEAPRPHPVVSMMDKSRPPERRWRRPLRALRLTPGEAERFWYRAGCVSAACLAAGATDLFGENVKIGRRRGARPGAPVGELWPYPIDLEMLGFPLRRLAETGLIGNELVGPKPGLGRWPSPRDDDGPSAFHRLREGGAGRARRLELVRTRRPWQRDLAGELVFDTAGNLGYGAYLPAYLRGLFDVWLTLLHHREALQGWLRTRPAPRGRVVVRPTASYASALDAALLGRRGGAAAWSGVRVPAPPRRGEPAWSVEERDQLARLDVPYFTAALGGALHALTPPPRTRLVRAKAQPFVTPLEAPQPLEARLAALSLPALGVALRDVVEHTGPLHKPYLADRRRTAVIEQPEPGRGAVTLEWRDAGKRLRFRWRGREVQVEVMPLAPRRAAAPELRRQLLRMDRLDRTLRQRFQESGFRDRATERTLERLVATAVAWLEQVLDEHGWPGRSLVGERAAEAACRLAQHADRFAAFQRRCLGLVEEAVQRGEATPRQRAYLTDQVRIRAGKKQVFGTKFRRVRGELVPFPIEAEALVDYRRRRVGLGSLASYARRVRRLFGAAAARGGKRGTTRPRPAGAAGVSR